MQSSLGLRLFTRLKDGMGQISVLDKAKVRCLEHTELTLHDQGILFLTRWLSRWLCDLINRADGGRIEQSERSSFLSRHLS